MIFVWLLVGIVAVAVAFLLPESSMDLWPAVDAAGIALIVYLLTLLVYILRPPIPAKKRLVAAFIATVSIVSVIAFWTGHAEQAAYQRETLLKIRSTIGRGVLMHHVSDAVLPVFEAYHAQGKRKARSLGRLFRDQFPSAIVGSNFREPMWENDTQQVLIPARLEEDLVEIVAVDKVGRGKDPAFVNSGGTRGRIEERFTLTEKGVSYDIIN
jgi:hypothetical protein